MKNISAKSGENSYPKRVAIVRVSAMGDIIHTLASIQFIKAQFKNISITWFVDEVFSEILKYNCDIDKIVSLPLKQLKKRFNLKKLVDIYKKIESESSREFDLIIDAQGLIKSAVISRVAGKNIAGLDKKSAKEPLGTFFYRYKFNVDCREIAPFRFASLISQALSFNITKKMLLNKKAYLFWDNKKDYSYITNYFHKTKKNIVVVVGGSNSSKIYPKERWIELISQLRMFNILLIAGSDSERDFAKYIEKNSIAVLLPKLSLNDLKFVISISNLLIGNDTGPSHIAWGLNRASIILFGSTPKTMMMETEINIAVSAKPNFKSWSCKFDKSDDSIKNIEPKEIAEKVLELLKYG